MSTKSSLAHGPNFHLYQEVFDSAHVYLELQGVAFEASREHVCVSIPVHVWEFIRRYSGAPFDYVDKTDAALRAQAEKSVDERLRKYQEQDAGHKAVAALAGGLVFGEIDSPREQQIAKGLAHFALIRSQQQQIRDALAELERLNENPRNSTGERE